MSRCSSNYTYFDPVKKAKVKAVPEGSQQGSSTSSCAWMALLGQFWQAENKTGSFDETAGYRSCRSALELCSMWSLRVTNFAQQVRRRSGWRVARGEKRLKIMSTADSVQYRDLPRCTILWSHRTSCNTASPNTNKLKSSNSLCSTGQNWSI